MNIAIIGGGGREHALARKIYYDKPKNAKLFCVPGNAGTSEFANNVELPILNFKQLNIFFKKNKIKLIIIGPEEPLVKGITDYFTKRNYLVFGPSKYAAKLEGSKAFVKKICTEYNIPTAKYKICKNLQQVKKYINLFSYPIVVKASGIAAGKGVKICDKREDVIKISQQIFKGKFKSSKVLILEEFLTGEEMSYFLLVDKKNSKFFGSAQDHKRAFEKDKGPNTGGMGAYSPSILLNKKLEDKIKKRIIEPTLEALEKRKKPFKGFLYAGLMIKNSEPYLIEYNVRMGDPECQVIIPKLKSNLYKLILSTVRNKLKNQRITWSKKKSLTVVLCSKGYPNNYEKHKIIKNLHRIKLRQTDFIYHAGTKVAGKKVFSCGGRVLNITSIAKNFLIANRNVYKILRKINWKYGFYRKDIGWKAITK